MTTAPRKTKQRRAAEAEAKRVLSTGYFQGATASRVFAFCPRPGCRHNNRIATVLPYGKSGAAAATAALIGPIADHLEDQHPGTLA